MDMTCFIAFIVGYLLAKILDNLNKEEKPEAPKETPPLVRWMSRPVGSKPITYEDWKKENGIKD